MTSKVPKNVNVLYEIIINGLNIDAVKGAMTKGIKAAIKVPSVVKISAGNYEGKLGPYKVFLKDILQLE